MELKKGADPGCPNPVFGARSNPVHREGRWFILNHAMPDPAERLYAALTPFEGAGQSGAYDPVRSNVLAAPAAATPGVRPGSRVPGREPSGRSFVRFPRPEREKLKPQI